MSVSFRVSGKHLSKSYGGKVSEFGKFHHGVAVDGAATLAVESGVVVHANLSAVNQAKTKSNTAAVFGGSEYDSYSLHFCTFTKNCEILVA